MAKSTTVVKVVVAHHCSSRRRHGQDHYCSLFAEAVAAQEFICKVPVPKNDDRKNNSLILISILVVDAIDLVKGPFQSNVAFFCQNRQ